MAPVQQQVDQQQQYVNQNPNPVPLEISATAGNIGYKQHQQPPSGRASRSNSAGQNDNLDQQNNLGGGRLGAIPENASTNMQQQQQQPQRPGFQPQRPGWSALSAGSGISGADLDVREYQQYMEERLEVYDDQSAAPDAFDAKKIQAAQA